MRTFEGQRRKDLGELLGNLDDGKRGILKSLNARWSLVLLALAVCIDPAAWSRRQTTLRLAGGLSSLPRSFTCSIICICRRKRSIRW